ncbi:hypothetical protein I4U23_024457 [Adineta vaga]|nr:hypothetical protein I4U23_024457 [Adineta vaga]
MIDQTIEILANQSNLSVQLMFDLYTPRPHFIITHKKQFRKVTATENEIKEVMQMVTDFLTDKPDFDTNAILSFHRGLWYQQNFKHFHAHLCVPKKAYRQEVKKMVTPEKCSNYWSSSTDYLTQMENDFISSKLKYNQYQIKCLSMAYRCINDPISYYVPLSQFNTSKFTLVFLACSPRIGIITKKKNIELKTLYSFMENFYFSARKKLSTIHPLFDNFGAHLCLYVTGKKNKNVNVVERTDRILFNNIQQIKSERIVGYIQMDEQLFLRWLHPIYHQTWLNEFKKSQHFVST